MTISRTSPSRTVLITRPREDSLVLAKRLKKDGFTPVVEPLLTVTFRNKARTVLQEALENDPQAVIVTSKHAIAALRYLTRLRDFPILTVGQATATVAIKAGFPHVKWADGDVFSLASYIKKHCKPHAGKLIYASGKNISANLAELLEEQDFVTERITVYQAAAATQLSKETVALLKEQALDTALFFSPRTAGIFLSLAEKAKMRKNLTSVRAYGASRRIAESLGKGWKEVVAAPTPDMAAMLSLLQSRRA